MQNFDRLANAVAKRTVSLRSPSELALDLIFDQPLGQEELTRISLEGKEAAGKEGIISVDASETRVRILMKPPLAGTIRASTLLKDDRSDEVVAYLAEATARYVATLKRPHGRIALDAILVERTGEVVVLGSELPALHALITPPYAEPADRWRTIAPEAGRGELADALSDVYAIGALYFHMLSGARYRGNLSATEASLACIEDAPPDLTELAANTREPLITLLSNALSADRSDRPSELALAIRVELRTAGKMLPTHGHISARVTRLSDPIHALYAAEPTLAIPRPDSGSADKPRFQKGVPLRVKPIEERVRKADNERSIELSGEAIERAPRSR